MLLYSNQQNLRLAFQVSGSVLFKYKVGVVALLVAGATAGVQLLIEYAPDYLQPKLPNTYAMSVLGMIVAFATVFRTNLAWQRYWEGLGQAHVMYAKWEDAFAQFAVFCRLTVEEAGQAQAAGDRAALAKIDRVHSEYLHVLGLFDLMSALAADRISHGDTECMDARKDKVSWSQHVLTQHELARSPDVSGAYEMPELFEGSFSTRAEASEKIGWKQRFAVKQVPTQEEMAILKASSKRVMVVMTWIISSISRIGKDLTVAPPILSRMYQELSNGMVGFEACCKISDVPFPFAYAQLQILLIGVFSSLLPVYVAVFTKSFVVGPLIAIVIFGSVYGVNEVAKELEVPFGSDLNDISLHDLHSRFVSVLEDMGSVLDVDGLHHASRKAAHQERVATATNELAMQGSGEAAMAARSAAAAAAAAALLSMPATIATARPSAALHELGGPAEDMVLPMPVVGPPAELLGAPDQWLESASRDEAIGAVLGAQRRTPRGQPAGVNAALRPGSDGFSL